MSVFVTDLRAHLQKKIMSAASAQEVEQHIQSALAGLTVQEPGALAVDRFINLMINDLGHSEDLDKTRQQQANIRKARIHLNELKLQRKFQSRLP